MDDIFKGLSPEKVSFLAEFMNKDKPLTMREVMPFLMASMREAKEKDINFTRPETQLLIELLSKDLPPAQQELIKKLKF